MDEEKKRKLEEKKKKLAELRRLKKERNEAANSSAPISASVPVRRSENVDIDSLVESLLKKPSAAGESTPQPTDTSPDTPSVVSQPVQPKRIVSLSIVPKVINLHVKSKEVECYSKGVQADESWEDIIQSEVAQCIATSTSEDKMDSTAIEATESTPIDETEVNVLKMSTVVELEPEEKVGIESSTDFVAFLEQSSRVVERSIALNETYDVTVDYGEDGSSHQQRNMEVLSLSLELQDKQNAREHSISQISWSPQHHELFLAAYSKRERSLDTEWRSGLTEDGLVQLWNLKSVDRPEYTFTCQSEVETAMFNPFLPHVVLGGTYCGEIVMWDLRAKNSPVQRSSLASDGHKHPVYSMTCVGSANAHSLATISTDGLMCLWSLNNLSAPSETKMLKNGKQDVAATCMSFPVSEANEFCVGAEDGNVFRAQVHGSKSGIQKQFSSHYGPITGMDFNAAKGGSGSSHDLLLTSSMDWTVKLWSHRHSSLPLKTFESASDYVYAVKWSPIHPALFATADGAGVVDLWNINHDTEVPRGKYQVSTTSALSAMQWTPDGKNIVVGDSHGKLSMLHVAPECSTPARDEWSQLENSISNFVEDLDKGPIL